MNPLIRFALKIVSLPVFDMTRDYAIVRRFQEWAGKREEVPPDFILLDEEIVSRDGSHTIPVRLFANRDGIKKGVMLFIHGGGYALGNVDTYTPVCLQLAKRTRYTVLAVDYRLAPEYPFPEGLNDCLEVLRFVVENDTDEYRPLTVIGDSAGGNLSTVACRRLKEMGLPLPDQQILIYPAVGWNYTENSPYASMHEKAEDFGLTRKKLVEYYDLYVPDGTDARHPDIAPIMAEDLSGLPPALVITAEHDPLRDEGEDYAKKLTNAGVPVELHRFSDVPHGFLTYERPFSEAVEKLYDAVYRFVRGQNRA